LTGFPLTAGYFSKDAVIEAAYMAQNPMHMYAFYMTVTAALFTSFYSWRLIFMTFHGKTRVSNEVLSHAHESPPSMMVPLVLLAVGALGAGAVFYSLFIGETAEGFWGNAIFTHATNNILEELHHAPTWVVFSPMVMMVLGFTTAWYFYIRSPETPKTLAKDQEMLYRFLLNKWYIDELYNVVFVKPAFWIGRFLWKQGDGRVIDGMGPDGIAARVLDVTRGLARLQSGYVYHYAFAMLIGIAALTTYFMFGGAL